MGQLDNKTALITGGTTGIGLAVAERMVEEGAHVFITGRRQVELDRAVARLGPDATGIRSDIADLDDLDRLFAAISDSGRTLDVLFANAGGGTFGKIEDITPESFDTTFGINVRGTLFTVQKALPLLATGASIIVTGSTSTARGFASFGVYSASKAALGQFTKVWAAELADRQIRVNTIVPGPTETPGLTGLADSPDQAQELLDGEAARVPLGRVGQPFEVANAVLFLASDQAAFITGSEIHVDGGESHVYRTLG